MSTTKKESKSKTPKSSSSGLDNIQQTYEKNRKAIHVGIIVLLVAVLGGLTYKYMYLEPREVKAATAMSMAQRYFELDSLQKSLEGDGQQPGFLRIISRYSGTESANLAHYYAGITYLKMEDFDQAIKHLEKFDGGSSYVRLAT